MSLWIESHTKLGGDKKLYKMCKELKINPPTAVGHLHYLWWWTMLNRTNDGDLIGLFPVDIARAAKWEGNPNKFLQALESCGFIKNSRINDWEDYAGHLLNARKRKKEYEERLKNVPKTKTERSESSVTGPDRTLPYRKDIKTGLLSEKDERIVLEDIAKKNHVAPESEAAKQRLDEIVGEISKIRDVKNPVAMARHKALKQ